MNNEAKILMDKVYYKNADVCKMEKMNRVIEDLFLRLHKESPEIYKDTIHAMEGVVYELTLEKAQHIVRTMFGEKWTYEQIKEYLSTHNITDHCIHFYIIMNKKYSKNKHTAKIYGKEEDAEFYFNLAKDSVYDKNAKPYHIEKHFM